MSEGMYVQNESDYTKRGDGTDNSTYLYNRGNVIKQTCVG